MVTAAILFATGLLVELCAVVLAPLGYQDESGFHLVAESPEGEAPLCAQEPT